MTLFGIHLGRMGLDQSALGILSPFVAVLGDLALALIIAYGVVIPARLFTRRASRRLERRAWAWCLEAGGRRRLRAVVRGWLDHRLRFAVRLRAARYSLTAALSRGLQIGLPAAAFVAATAPVFGMSWFFDTENWAAGMWNRWAEARTDTWREAMVARVFEHEPRVGGEAFAVSPAGITGGADFSFIVIGDTGEGDASQQILKDQLLAVARREDVRFIVVSSDVVYPVGAMKDYEAKFWLPFKGTGKPVYAIPGNHDWFDALEAFAATFMTEEAARQTMRARIEVDKRLTSTTDGRIEELIAQAGQLRRQYGVPTGFQRAPFFQVQTPDFALLAVDTGVRRPSTRPSTCGSRALWRRRAARSPWSSSVIPSTQAATTWRRATRRSSRSTGSCGSTGSPSSWRGTPTTSSTTPSGERRGAGRASPTWSTGVAGRT